LPLWSSDLGHTLLRHRQARYARLGSQISSLMSLWRPLSLSLSSRTKASTTGNRDLACLSLRDKRRRIAVTKICRFFSAFAFAHRTRTCIPAPRQTLKDPRFISAWERDSILCRPRQRTMRNFVATTCLLTLHHPCRRTTADLECAAGPTTDNAAFCTEDATNLVAILRACA